MLQERADLLAFARRNGLDLVTIRPGELTYQCPPFERSAPRASGLASAVPATWRRGDLIEFRRTAAPAVSRPIMEPSETWREVMLVGARIRFRAGQDAGTGPADPRLIRLIDRDILPSVSRRDPLRDRVAVWTCGNKVFSCRSPGLLAVIADALASGHPVASAAEEHLGRAVTELELARIQQATAQLTRLARDPSASSGHQPGSADSIVALPGAPPDVTSPNRPSAGRHRKGPYPPGAGK